jgi:alkanesulfonate monooxygenase SsuD/methylene tetrahydromethanopterin reductase-like flavin-dependent oxidoreductase (luciferase family)
MRVGIQLPEAEREVRWPEYVAMARAAEDAGFDSIWLGDHLLYRDAVGRPRGPWEVWTLLGALAAATSRVALGPLVACTSFHNPAMLAKMAATVDEISGGRLILGLGAGWNETEYRAYGFPFDHRVSRFGEAFTIIRTLLRDGQIDFAGSYYEARDCELRPRPAGYAGPPLLIGSNGRRMLELTLPHVKMWNSWYDAIDNRPAGLRPLRETVDEMCRTVGRNPTEIERTVAVLVRLPGGTARKQGDTDGRDVAPIVGDAAQIAESLLAFAREGIGHVQLVVEPITLDSIEQLVPVLEILDRSGPL